MALRVQFIHGLEGNPHGTKARLFAAEFDALTPAMDTSDFESCVEGQSATLTTFAPQVLVGSSFGGAVAVELLRRGLWTGPTLLLAQAALRVDPEAELPHGVRVWLVHGIDDDVVPIADSRRLAATGSPNLVRLIELEDDHRLSASVASGLLVALVRELAGTAPCPG